MAKKRLAKKYEKQMNQVKQEEPVVAVTEVKDHSEVCQMDLCLQYQGHETTMEEIQERISGWWNAKGHSGSIKKVQIYLKPEDGLAYFVVNEEFQGQVEL